SRLASSFRPCPANGMSGADDPQHDIRINDGMQLANDQPGNADLVHVTHSRDGDALCFQLTFAGQVPDEGSAEIRIRPNEASVAVTWQSTGRVLGQTLPDDNSSPVSV